MKQLLILSGKGGTGKTTVAGAFIKLSNVKAFADCDIDAPNLHLIMEQKSKPDNSDYYGLDKAIIDKDKCIKCNLCYENCRFDAIDNNDGYAVKIYDCEGCGVCEAICPESAISLVPYKAGDMTLYKEPKVFSTAELKMGSGNSGLLVTEVKKNMKMASEADFAIIDGSPGIGCPVIASISGVSMVLIVAEPSLSGISDMKRIIETAERFNTKLAVCVNKYDTNIENNERIKRFCQDNNIEFVGEIPFDKNVVEAVNNGLTIVDIDCAAGDAIQGIYIKTIKILNNQEIKMSENCNESCSSCSEECGGRKEEQIDFLEKPHPQSSIKNVIGVISGKGGVGKSLVTSMLAVTMNRRNHNVAILDADITGPSIPKSFGITEKAKGNGEGILPCKSKTGIDVMSINLLLENTTDPVVWRGPVIAGTVKQFWTDVIWKDIDFMFIDMPPGTGDVPLTVFQSIPINGIIVVTSPQELVSMIVEKAVKMAEMMNVPIIGIVENMSYFKCPDCNKEYKIFGDSKIEDAAKNHGLKVIAKLPIDPKIATMCDKGMIELYGDNLFINIAEILERGLK
jgi:MinD superfamily P-loop ATPase